MSHFCLLSQLCSLVPLTIVPSAMNSCVCVREGERVCECVCEFAAGSLACLKSQVDRSSPLTQKREEKGRDKGGGW